MNPWSGLYDDERSCDRGFGKNLPRGMARLPNYADGSIPEADVLLTAFLKWDWRVRIENTGGTPGWCEFGLSDVEGGIERRKAEPTQLSLFDALEDLDQSIDTLKKSVGRAEAEIRRALSGKRRSA